ncbi:UNVERIFIED_CONTAM: hypothetical protein K2H54_058565 [Gekko kuhli]
MKNTAMKSHQQNPLPFTSKAELRPSEPAGEHSLTNIQNLPALLDRLEIRLSEKISQSTDPIREQLMDIQTSLKVTTQTAEAALKMGATLKSDITDIRKAYSANDEDTGRKMLQALGLQEDGDFRRSQKRKHIPSATPEKCTKIPIREEVAPDPEDISDSQPEAVAD